MTGKSSVTAVDNRVRQTISGDDDVDDAERSSGKRTNEISVLSCLPTLVRWKGRVGGGGRTGNSSGITNKVKVAPHLVWGVRCLDAPDFNDSDVDDRIDLAKVAETRRCE